MMNGRRFFEFVHSSEPTYCRLKTGCIALLNRKPRRVFFSGKTLAQLPYGRVGTNVLFSVSCRSGLWSDAGILCEMAVATQAV